MKLNLKYAIIFWPYVVKIWHFKKQILVFWLYEINPLVKFHMIRPCVESQIMGYSHFLKQNNCLSIFGVWTSFSIRSKIVPECLSWDAWRRRRFDPWILSTASRRLHPEQTSWCQLFAKPCERSCQRRGRGFLETK